MNAKGPYIIGRRLVHIVRGVRREGAWQYWTAGVPRTSYFVTDAFRFSSYNVALECTGTHRDLRDSDEWRVLRADGSSPLLARRPQN